jgi:uncharacterized protein (UPF0264 family)
LKEPDRGALGAVDAATARDVVACVAGRVPVSAAGGELMEWPAGLARQLFAVRGVSYFKLGLANCRGWDWGSALRDVQREIACGDMQLVAVIYADDLAANAPSAEAIVEFAGEAECPWVLIDTFDKAGGALADHLSATDLRTLLQSLRTAGRRTVVAGSLSGESIAALPMELVDMVAVRGAACERGRRGAVSEERVAQLRAILSDCR